MKTLLGKKPSDLEELQQILTNSLPSSEPKKDKIVRDAVKSTSLPSEVQKSMSEILAERLKQKPKVDDVDDTVKRVQREMKVDYGTVNQNLTTVKDDQRMGKSKRLG
jgi:hypothetical protein